MFYTLISTAMNFIYYYFSCEDKQLSCERMLNDIDNNFVEEFDDL